MLKEVPIKSVAMDIYNPKAESLVVLQIIKVTMAEINTTISTLVVPPTPYFSDKRNNNRQFTNCPIAKNNPTLSFNPKRVTTYKKVIIA